MRSMSEKPPHVYG
uniref:Uncharacterized protein n=1 Tax=Anguilla anguilla TaxID=7936 RepID=A0A0E9UJ59_ANGAN